MDEREEQVSRMSFISGDIPFPKKKRKKLSTFHAPQIGSDKADDGAVDCLDKKHYDLIKQGINPADRSPIIKRYKSNKD